MWRDTWYWGGDSNTSLDQILDKSNPRKAVLKHTPKQSGEIARLLHSYDLIDIWRDAHPTTRDYTFYSHIHKTYSRIDHLFTLSPLLSFVSSAKILPMAWSDHSSIQVTLTNLWSKPQPSSWRLNESLLNYPIIAKEVEVTLKDYFRDNPSSSSTPIMIWTAHKATIRCKLIQLASRVKRARELTISQQNEELQRLMREQRAKQNLDLRGQIDAARMALNLSLTTKAEKSIRWSRHRYYTMGDKPNKLLVRKLTPRPFTPALPKLRLQNGQTTQNPQPIQQEFFTFYSKLYDSPAPLHKAKEEEFLRDITLPTLDQDHIELMDAEFTAGEVAAAIKNLNPSKTPGPNGFSGHYYRKYSEVLTPHLCSFYNELRKGSPLALHENNAFIHILPKPNKDHGDCANYRPISLINVDLKIMTKILATRMNSFISKYIHPDQVGFVPNRQAPDQTRRVIDIISALNSGWEGSEGSTSDLIRHTQGLRLSFLGLSVLYFRTLWVRSDILDDT